MRIEIHLRPPDDVAAVPIHYNYAIQAMIYRHLSRDLATWLHNEGYVSPRPEVPGSSGQGRAFKLFVFSRLFGRFKRMGDELIYRDLVRLYVASPVGPFLQDLVQMLMRSGIVQIGRSELHVEQVAFLEEVGYSASMVVHALSPITVYSTLLSQDGRKKTYYYSPHEAEFSELVAANLRKKYSALYGKEPPPEWTVKVTPLRVRTEDQAIVTFKGTVIKGWLGSYRLEGSPELIRLALEAGAGSKNSQGFGFLLPAGERRGRHA